MKYKYRIKVLTNGLGEKIYIPEVKNKYNLFNWEFPNYWEEIRLVRNIECKETTSEERKELAYRNIEEHKQTKFFTENIIIF